MSGVRYTGRGRRHIPAAKVTVAAGDGFDVDAALAARLCAQPDFEPADAAGITLGPPPPEVSSPAPPAAPVPAAGDDDTEPDGEPDEED